MANNLEFSFDDEPVRKFFYDIHNKIIQVHFSGYYDLQKNTLIDGPCTFTIANWKEAKCRIGDDDRLHEIDKHMGIFSMILSMRLIGDQLEILVNTLDNRYLTLFFKDPDLKLK